MFPRFNDFESKKGKIAFVGLGYVGLLLEERANTLLSRSLKNLLKLANR